MSESGVGKVVCLAEQENGHHTAYLTWTHQADGLCYFKCSMCGWIKPDFSHPPREVDSPADNKPHTAIALKQLRHGMIMSDDPIADVEVPEEAANSAAEKAIRALYDHNGEKDRPITVDEINVVSSALS